MRIVKAELVKDKGDGYTIRTEKRTLASPLIKLDNRKMQEFSLYSNGTATFSGYGVVEKYLALTYILTGVVRVVGNLTGPTVISMERRKKTQKGAIREYISLQLPL